MEFRCIILKYEISSAWSRDRFKMPHFIVNSAVVNGDYITITEKELYNHIAKSLRSKTGQKLLFIDENEVQYVTVIENITSREIYTKVVDSYKSTRKLDIDLNLAQSVLKPDAQFSLIQKATELGVKGIIPLVTDNCTIKESIIKAKTDKWQKIAVESVKQCERADIPKVYDVLTLLEIIKKHDFDMVLVFAEREADTDLKTYFKQNKPQNKSILAIIGPEGGFSDKEFEFFKENKIPKISLGNLIYRADTAAVVALSNIICEIEHA